MPDCNALAGALHLIELSHLHPADGLKLDLMPMLDVGAYLLLVCLTLTVLADQSGGRALTFGTLKIWGTGLAFGTAAGMVHGPRTHTAG